MRHVENNCHVHRLGLVLLFSAAQKVQVIFTTWISIFLFRGEGGVFWLFGFVVGVFFKYWISSDTFERAMNLI